MSTYPDQTANVDVTAAATFIPEIWSDEIRAAYEKSLVLANFVKKMPMTGKKGDTINIPAPIRGSASSKVKQEAVTLINNTELNVQVVIDKHYEYSRMIEDIVTKQALSSLRRFYTEDAGYALSKQVDDDLWAMGRYLGDDNGSGTDWVHSNSFYSDGASEGALTAYAVDTVTTGDDLTDLTIRAALQQLDDADVPMTDRCFAIPPSAANTIRGIDRYNSVDFVNGQGVMTGKIGELYGVNVIVTSNSPVTEAAADNTAHTGDLKAAMLFHRDAIIFAEQLGVRSQTQYKQEYLADLFTADTIYGTKVYRPESALVINLPQ